MELLRDKIKRDTYMVSKLCGMIARGDLRDNHPQQRKSGQWDNATRDNFIVTVIKNEDFDPIKICEQLTDEGIVLWLIDGLQRSTTIENYKSGKFKLGRNIDPCTIEYQEAVKVDGKTVYQNVSYDLRGKAYKDLPEKLKEDFDNCPVDVRKHLDCTDEEVGRHIVRYNSGRAMVVAQKIVAYMHNTAEFVKRLSGHGFFNDCANYSDTSDKNGDVDKVVSETIMGLNFYDKWTKEANKIGKYLNDNATEEMFDNFGSYLDRLLEVVTPETGKLFTKKNAFFFFMLFDRFNKSNLSDDKFQLFLENYEQWKNIKVQVSHEYKIDTETDEKTNILSFKQLDKIKSTKDKGVIEDKLHILETVMNEFLHIDESILKESVEEIGDTTITEEVNYVEFIKENVGVDIDNEDIQSYVELFKEDLSVEVDNSSKLLEENNLPSMLAIIIRSIELGMNITQLKAWMVDFFKSNLTYNTDQKANYLYMVGNMDNFLQKGAIA